MLCVLKKSKYLCKITKSTLIKPMRVQRLRKKGFKLQNASRSGLPVKYVDRPTKCGNPFRLTPDGFIQCYSTNRNILDPWIIWSYSGGFGTKDIADLYGRWLDGELKATAPYLPTPPSIEELKGKDLACFFKVAHNGSVLCEGKDLKNKC